MRNIFYTMVAVSTFDPNRRPLEPTADFELVRRIAQSDEHAFEQFFTIFWKDLFRYAMRILDDQREAEDIVQELFIDLWEGRHTLSIEINPRAYLFGMLRKKILKNFRSKGIREKHMATLQTMLMNEHVDSPLRALIARDNLNSLQHYLTTLPRKEREVFILHQIEGYSVKEISERFATSEQTVRNQIANAFAKVFPVVLKLLS